MEIIVIAFAIIGIVLGILISKELPRDWVGNSARILLIVIFILLAIWIESHIK